MSNGTLLFDVELNPKAEKLQEAVNALQQQQQAQAEKVEKKAELEKGQVQGFLEEMQKFSARLANGGFSKGMEQIKSGFETFKTGLSSGKGAATSAAEGLSMLGVEAQAVGTAITATATLVVAAVVALVEFETAAIEAADSMQRQRLDLAALGVDFSKYRETVNGVVDIQEALLVQNIAIANGHRLNATELATVNNQIRDWSLVTGDANGASQLWTQALAGNIESARALGIAVSDYATKQEVMNQALLRAQQNAAATGDVSSTIGEAFQGLKNDLGEVWDALKVFLGGAIGFILSPFIAVFVGSIKLAAEGVRALKSELDSLGLTNFAEKQAQIDAQRAQAAHAQAVIEQNRVATMRVEDELKRSTFATTQLELRAQTERVTAGERLADLERQERDTRAGILQLQQLSFAGEREQLENQDKINGLQQRLTGIIQARNNLNSFNNTLARTQEGLLVRQAQFQAGVSSENAHQLSLTDQINAAVEYRNRLLTIARLLGHELTEEEARNLAQTQTFINQGREQQRQAATQLQDAQLQLQIQNEIARATGGQVNNRIRELNLTERLRQVEERAARINLSGNSQQAIDNYNRLTQQANNLREALEQIRTTADNNPIDGMLQKALEAMGRLSNQAELNSVFDALVNAQAEYFALIREGEALERQRSLSLAATTQQALEAQFAASQLTATQLQSLGAVDAAYQAITAAQDANTRRVAEIQASIGNQILSEQQRNEARRELVDLTGQQIALEQQLLSLQQAQNGPSAMSQIGAAVRGLAGEYRSFGAVAGGIASQGLQALGGAFKSHLAAVITGKETIGQALQAMLHETLLSLAQESAIKAIFNTAEGIAAFASGNVPKGTQHMIAAGTYTAVAVGAGLGAAATVPSAPTTSSTGSSAGRSASESAKEPSTPVEPRVININGMMYLTKEQVEDAILEAMNGADNRSGRR